MLVKCLSIKNPISYLVASGVKDIENRTWQTAYRGTIYIHSSGQFDFFCFDEKHLKSLANFDRLNNLADNSRTVWAMDVFYRWECVQYGLSDLFDKKANLSANKEKGPQLISHAIIGKVDLVDIVRDNKSEWALDGQFHWVLENAELFDKPILGVEGRLKLFDVEIDV